MVVTHGIDLAALLEGLRVYPLVLVMKVGLIQVASTSRT